ncbi:NAD-dependent epimerase/dehydratase family protein [Sphingomonas sp.]|uniref:NAD-dependent epimerase/dehydratase family protein n=1 Tax=Sphingomonas sp. TaxID=28214 RepID=UPI0038AFAE56
MRIAVTGGTGFVGAHLLDAALGAGHRVNALTRRDQPQRDGVDWILGDLQDRDALERLVDGADAVIHVAGTISAANAAAFEKGNVAGTLAMLAAATAGGVRRFVHVSSLAAREPKLSLYGGSKAKAEELVHSSGLDWAIVRPPAVYGPGDKETLELFRMAKLGLMLMPPKGRVSVIHADDLASLLLALAGPAVPSNILIEADDGKPGGWSHREFARALAGAVGTRPAILSSPGILLRAAAHIDQLWRGEKAKLTTDRAAYFSHRNWVVEPKRACPPQVWQPRIDTLQGLADTAAWYREQGWL